MSQLQFSQPGPYRERYSFPEPSNTSLMKTKLHLSLIFPGKGAPFHIHPTGSYGRIPSSPEQMICSFIFSESLVKEPSHIKGTYGHRPRSPTGTEGLLHWGAVWFSKGIVYDTAITNPVPCSLQHDTFHLGLGRPEPC
jgi:hypothetical protein